jgi:hypothetical protein
VTLAVVGIVATAVVGLAGSGVAFLSSREDRHTQLAVAHDNRVYDRRASVYLDAIDFVEGQKEAFESYANSAIGEHTPYSEDPPRPLTDRLIAFGSSGAVKALSGAEGKSTEVVQEGIDSVGIDRNGVYLARHDRTVADGFFTTFKEFRDQVTRFEETIARELR